MAGRGRGMTTPSWMTSPGLGSTQTHQPVTTSAQPTTQPTSQESNNCDWQQFYNEQGVPYYYNHKTGESSWEKPAELRSQCPWQKFTTDEGTPYYYNEITQKSEWEMPAEYKTWLDSQNVPSAEKYPALPPVSAAKAAVPQKVAEELSQRDDETSKDTQMETENDSEAFSFNYEDQEKAREEFKQLLESHTELNWQSDFKSFGESVQGDKRWTDLKIDSEKEYLFEKHLINLKRTSKENDWEKKVALRKKVRDVLEETSWVNVDCQWAMVKEKLLPTIPSIQQLEPLELLNIFEEHMRSLEKKDIENDRSEMSRIRRASRKARENFKALLDSLYSEGKFTYRTSWQTVLELIKDESAYKGLLEAEGSTPGELYGDFIDAALADKYSDYKNERDSDSSDDETRYDRHRSSSKRSSHKSRRRSSSHRHRRHYRD